MRGPKAHIPTRLPILPVLPTLPTLPILPLPILPTLPVLPILPTLPTWRRQVFKELEPGLNISRLSEADFLNFVRLATYCTRYVRLREVSAVVGSPG